MKFKKIHISIFMGVGFASLNVLMYFLIKKFWIGGSSFLPLIGICGEKNSFIYALAVNIGFIIGAFISAFLCKEFMCKKPSFSQILRAVSGGILIGFAISICPGTCTTAFIVGIPMLTVSSFIVVAGVAIGVFIMYKLSVNHNR